MPTTWLILFFAPLLVVGNLFSAEPENGVASEQQPHWAFVPLVDVRAPRTLSPAHDATAIDSFVHAALAKAGLHASPAANRETSVSYTHLTLPTKRIV